MCSIVESLKASAETETEKSQRDKKHDRALLRMVSRHENCSQTREYNLAV
jgi:hypothetical protein